MRSFKRRRLHLCQAVIFQEGPVAKPVVWLTVHSLYFYLSFADLIFIEAFVLFARRSKQRRYWAEAWSEEAEADVCDTGSLPPLLDQRGHQQVDDPHACQPYDHPERDEPRGGVVRDGSGQGWEDFEEFQGGIGQQEGAVDAMPGLSVRRIRNEPDLERLSDKSVRQESGLAAWMVD